MGVYTDLFLFCYVLSDHLRQTVTISGRPADSLERKGKVTLKKKKIQV